MYLWLQRNKKMRLAHRRHPRGARLFFFIVLYQVLALRAVQGWVCKPAFQVAKFGFRPSTIECSALCYWHYRVDISAVRRDENITGCEQQPISLFRTSRLLHEGCIPTLCVGKADARPAQPRRAAHLACRHTAPSALNSPIHRKSYFT
ncbi:hypothetical protein EVAR_52718_1 [Eumeta japonica]|uniref:Uncharacterized protein n=1 Tax=Eumeta variegata TaxID=151549 RepID=A0A4C1ZFX3_EUMVA|nr:hypothetical protein EVAR_52718_1 [Eumeta japonica]